MINDQQEAFTSLYDYKRFLSRRKWYIILPLAMVIGVSVALACLLPPVYRSTSTILIEAQQVPQDLIRTTVTGYAEERIKTITAQIFSRRVLMKIIKDFNLYADKRDEVPVEEIIDMMRNDIAVEMVSAEVPDRRGGRAVTVNVAFTVSYEGKDPQKVMDVTNRLTSLFLEHNLQLRKNLARTTTDFLQEQADQYRSITKKSEEKIAAFKQQHLTEMPELMGLNLQTERQIREKMADVDLQIRTLKDRIVYLDGQLATVSPDIPVRGSDGQVADPSARLRMLRSQQISMSASLSSRHPDMVKLRREIENLEKKVGHSENIIQLREMLRQRQEELKNKSAQLKPAHPDMVRLRREIDELKDKIARSARSDHDNLYRNEPTNPAYINLQTQIKAAGIELAGLKAQKKELAAKWEDYVSRLEKMPQVEKEYRDLTRDYEAARQQYSATMAKLMEARQGQSLEQHQAGEKFTVIDPPQLPERPIKPNRLAIVLIGVVLGTGVGIGAAALAEISDSTICIPADVKRITGTSPLVSIVDVSSELKKGKKK